MVKHAQNGIFITDTVKTGVISDDFIFKNLIESSSPEVILLSKYLQTIYHSLSAEYIIGRNTVEWKKNALEKVTYPAKYFCFNIDPMPKKIKK